MLYENQACPVCKRLFENGDDVVCCPDCGTPHHRECYNLIGHCVNKGLHKANYSYYDDHREAQSKDDGAAPVKEENENRPPFFPPAGNGQPMFSFTNSYENDSSTVDGESVADVAATVRSNVPRFMNVFKRMEQSGKSTGWNWGAFLFEEYYLFFRKMYKQAITLFCISITLRSVFTLLVGKLAPETIQAIYEMNSLIAGGDSNAVMQKAESIYSLSDYSTFTALVAGYIIVSLVIRICVGIFADKMYKTTVTDIIKKTNEQLDDGAAFSVPTFGAQEDSFNLSQEQMRRLYLSKRGGVSIWAPVAAYLVLQLISRLF